LVSVAIFLRSPITLAVFSDDTPPSSKIFCTPSNNRLLRDAERCELLKNGVNALRQFSGAARAIFYFRQPPSFRLSASLEIESRRRLRALSRR